jgi:holo-ACP synthase CitX
VGLRNIVKKEIEVELEAILKGREARRDFQRELLEEHLWVLQITLNIPGTPKNIPGDSECLLATEKALYSPGFPQDLRVRKSGENAAGKTLFFAGDTPSPRRIKEMAVALEEHLPWGRLLDMDVLTASGALSRKELGFPPRKCLLCDEEAKICARLGKHGFEELRSKAEELLSLALKEKKP